MNEPPPVPDATVPAEPEPNTHKTRNLLIVLVVLVLALSFGKAIGNGYYFGGCDEAAHTRHYITHILGFKMCRDEHVESEAEPSGPAAPSAPAAATATPKHEYGSPCSLYVQHHNALLEITGSEAAADCERFVNRAGQTPWTTEAQATSATRSVVCELTSANNQEHAVVTDTGSQEYGSAACKQLSGEGWG